MTTTTTSSTPACPSSTRLPGWYWVKWRSKLPWIIGYWSGGYWNCHSYVSGSQSPTSDKEMWSIDERRIVRDGG